MIGSATQRRGIGVAAATATLVGILVPAASSHPAASLVFPVIGGASYFDDWGAPRPQGRHEGNDLLCRRWTPVVAVADGVAHPHTSARGGFMLYLRAATREYVYVHLNNDRTRANDNSGGPEVAYAPGIVDGLRVHAGQHIGWCGDSGDADGTTHVHFELHDAGTPVDPYRALRRATVTAFAVPVAKPAVPVTLRATGTVAFVADDDTGSLLALRAVTVRADGQGTATLPRARTLLLRLPPTLGVGLTAGQRVRVRTTPAAPTIARQQLRPGTWSVARLVRVGRSASTRPTARNRVGGDGAPR